MTKPHDIRLETKYQLLVSVIGLVLVFMMTVYPPIIATDFMWRKEVVGLIFSTFCFLGVLAVFAPNQCGKLIDTKKQSNNSDLAKPNKTSISLKGHHPNCGKYSDHTFLIRDKTFCAACIGLLFGGLLALAGTAAYFFWDMTIFEQGSLIVFLGIVGVILGLFQFKFKSLLRLFANIVFVLGALFVLVGVDKSAQSIFFDLFVVCLIVFCLFTRISLSQLDHKIICSSCKIENCRVRQ